MIIRELVKNREDADFFSEKIMCSYLNNKFLFLDMEDNGDLVFNQLDNNGFYLDVVTASKYHVSKYKVLERETFSVLMR